MELTPIVIISAGLVCVILGLLAGLLLNTLSTEPEEPVEKEADTPPGGRKGQYTPVVRLWRERSTDTLVVEIEGKSVVAPGALNEEQRQRLEKTARDLRAWLGMGLAGAETSGEPIQPPAAPAPYEISDMDLNRAIGTPSPAPSPAYTPAVSKPPAQKPVQSRPATPATPAPPPPVTPKGKEGPAAAPEARSIVMQIEDILQDMIAGTPLAQRGVHLIEDPTRGVIVQIGLNNYLGIDSVPDPQIRGVIQSAVQEWEKSQ